jgi:hypothetical protein
MNRKKSLFGALVVGALCIAAFNAAAASASTWEVCGGANGGGTLVRWNSGCSEPVNKGPNETFAVPNSLTGTPITAKGASSFSLAATVGEVKFKVGCTGMSSTEAVVNNGGSGTTMTATGTGVASLTGCTVAEPAACSVAATLPSTGLNLAAEGTSLKFAPEGGGKFMAITVSGALCPAALKGEKEVKGSATSAEVTMVKQGFTAASGSTLTISGQTVTFIGEYTAVVTATGESLGIGTP